MAFPLFWMAIPFAGGIWLGSVLGLEAGAWAAAAGLFLTAAWILVGLKKTAAAFGLSLAVCAALGAGLFVLADGRYEANALRRLPLSTYAEFTGTLLRSPGRGLDRDSLTLRVQSVQVLGRTEPARGVVRISVPHSSEFPGRIGYSTGDRLAVSAQVVSPREYHNFGEPFSRMYLKTLGLHVQASTKSPLLVRQERPGKALDPRRLVSRLRQAFQRALENGFPAARTQDAISPEGAVLEALILGERGRMDPDTTRALQRTGLFHLFAISGAHIGIISFLVFALLKVFRLRPRSSYAVLLVFLLFYALLVEGRSSVIRAVVMASVYIVGKLLWKDVHVLNTLGLSALLILIVNPFQLFDAGFQLTFTATLGILLFFPHLKKRLPRLPFKISDMFGLSLAAQAAVLPIIARSFHRVIFSGLLLNLLGIPLVGLIMAAGYVFLPLSLAARCLAKPAAAALAFLVRAFLASSRLLDGIPFLSYRIPTPPLPVVLAYFAGLLALLWPSRYRIGRRAGTAVGLAAFLLLVIYPFPASVRELTVTFLDVGQGDSVLVEFPGRAKMLVDGGGIPVGTFDVGENVVSPFLWDKGIRRLDLLVLTHAHPDHFFGLEAVAGNFRLGEFWESSVPPPEARYDRLKRALAGTRIRRVARGETFARGGVEVEVLSPPAVPAEGAPVENDASIVLRLRFGRTAVLLTGDIGAAVEAELLEAGLDLRSQVLKSPHHGSNSSSSAAFLERVRPETVVISVGRGNAYNLPHPEILERYRAFGVRVFRTDLDGAVEIRSDGLAIRCRTDAEGRASAGTASPPTGSR